MLEIPRQMIGTKEAAEKFFRINKLQRPAFSET
jgi:hypothetical protein